MARKPDRGGRPGGGQGVWKNSYSENTSRKIWAAKFTARHPNLVALELSNFKCGHDAPIYSVIEETVESSGTPYFYFKDIDENKPAGSIKIRIETIDYFLKRYREEMSKKRLKRAEVEKILVAYEAQLRSGLIDAGAPIGESAAASCGQPRPCGQGDHAGRAMKMLDQKVMFEIYREPGYSRRYRVIYFTELGDADRESEINRAMAGIHYYDGFIKDWRKDEARAIIAAWVERLNQGEELDPEALGAELAEFTPA